MSAVVRPAVPHIRPMQTEDVAQVMTIEQAMYPHPWTERIFADCLRVGYCCRIGELDGRFAGYGIMSSGAGEAHILNLCVSREYQRRGLGRALLLQLLEEAGRRGADTAFLEVRPSNHGAITLYEDLGFNRIGTRKDYYPAVGGREDAVIMALVLSYGAE